MCWHTLHQHGHQAHNAKNADDMSIRKFARKVYSSIPFKQPVYTLLRALVPLPRSVYQHLHFKGIITVDVGEGRTFRMRHHGYMIENELFWRGMEGWERISFRLWKELSHRASIIVDIGANTGVYALIAQAANPQAQVIAVEPILRVYDKLMENIALNGSRIRAFRAAITDHDGTGIIYDQKGAEHVLAVSMEPDWGGNKGRESVEIPVRTLPSIMKEAGGGPIDLLKIDVEGHEAAVLEGARDLIRQDRPSILIEVLTSESAVRLEPYFEGCGYIYFAIDELSWPPVRIPKLEKSPHYNILVITPEKAASIGLG